jgi:hypothetical protein
MGLPSQINRRGKRPGEPSFEEFGSTLDIAVVVVDGFGERLRRVVDDCRLGHWHCLPMASLFG